MNAGCTPVISNLNQNRHTPHIHRSPHSSAVERVTSNDEVVSSILAEGISFGFYFNLKV
jgi:hypothetical protein